MTLILVELKMENRLMVQGLASFVHGLANKKIYVELRGGIFAIGVLEVCDCYLNLQLRDSVILRPNKNENVDQFFISGRHIRYIHLEHYVDVIGAIKKTCNQIKRRSRNPRLNTGKRIALGDTNS